MIFCCLFPHPSYQHTLSPWNFYSQAIFPRSLFHQLFSPSKFLFLFCSTKHLLLAQLDCTFDDFFLWWLQMSRSRQHSYFWLVVVHVSPLFQFLSFARHWGRQKSKGLGTYYDISPQVHLMLSSHGICLKYTEIRLLICSIFTRFFIKAADMQLWRPIFVPWRHLIDSTNMTFCQFYIT